MERDVNRRSPAAVKGVIGVKALQRHGTFVRSDSQSVQFMQGWCVVVRRPLSHVHGFLALRGGWPCLQADA